MKRGRYPQKHFVDLVTPPQSPSASPPSSPVPELQDIGTLSDLSEMPHSNTAQSALVPGATTAPSHRPILKLAPRPPLSIPAFLSKPRRQYTLKKSSHSGKKPFQSSSPIVSVDESQASSSSPSSGSHDEDDVDYNHSADPVTFARRRVVERTEPDAGHVSPYSEDSVSSENAELAPSHEPTKERSSVSFLSSFPPTPHLAGSPFLLSSHSIEPNPPSPGFSSQSVLTSPPSVLPSHADGLVTFLSSAAMLLPDQQLSRGSDHDVIEIDQSQESQEEEKRQDSESGVYEVEPIDMEGDHPHDDPGELDSLEKMDVIDSHEDLDSSLILDNSQQPASEEEWIVDEVADSNPSRTTQTQRRFTNVHCSPVLHEKEDDQPVQNKVLADDAQLQEVRKMRALDYLNHLRQQPPPSPSPPLSESIFRPTEHISRRSVNVDHKEMRRLRRKLKRMPPDCTHFLTDRRVLCRASLTLQPNCASLRTCSLT